MTTGPHYPSRIVHTGDPVAWAPTPPTPQAVEPERNVRRLLGPRGEVLRTFADAPPVGFHQGQRGRPR